VIARSAEFLLDPVGDLPEMGIVDIGDDQADGFRMTGAQHRACLRRLTRVRFDRGLRTGRHIRPVLNAKPGRGYAFLRLMLQTTITMPMTIAPTISNQNHASRNSIPLTTRISPRNIETAPGMPAPHPPPFEAW